MVFFHDFKLINMLTAIPAHLFNPLNTRDSNFASRTIFQENDTIVELAKF